MKTILLAGGAGYIGTHTAVELLDAGYQVVIADNYSNSCPEAVRRVEEITGKSVKTYEVDIKDSAKLETVFQENAIDAVIHFAGLKSVSESIKEPLAYYENNVTGTLVLLDEMLAAGVNRFIFSSSATVYGNPESVPLSEQSRTGGTTNPYGTSKLMVEQILADFSRAQPDFRITCLRYFNPVGAHPSGRIGEDPNGIPNNLVPYISQVAIGKLKTVSVYGNDYPTPDGTGVRDYIHVVDLAIGHVKAIHYIFTKPGLDIINLGTGRGYSVLEMVKAFGEACGKEIPYEIKARRPGDIATCYCDATKAKEELGWVAERGIEEMCADSWRWQSNNPDGYRS